MTPPVEAGGQGHTPGPWDCTGAMFPDDHMGGVYYRIQAEGIDMRAANARLIAAAPEMLKALEAWHLYDSRDDSGPNAGVQMMLDYDRALTLTRAAIAKARGHE